MAYTVIASVGGVGTSSNIDTTGANLIVLLSHSDSLSFTDNKSNTYVPLTPSPTPLLGLAYAYNPTVGTGHNFTAAQGYGYIGALALSGAVASPFDQENTSRADAVTSIQPGSITPTEDDEIVIVGIGPDNTWTSPNIDGGFTQAGTVEGVSFVNYGAIFAYLIQTSATAANPTGSWTNTQNAQAVIASFKASGGGGGGNPWHYYAQSRQHHQRRDRWQRRNGLWLPRYPVAQRAA